MRILLLNANPVVSRLVELAAANKGAELEEVSHLSRVSTLSYDLVFVDDASYDEEAEAMLEALQRGRTVFFSGRENPEEIGEMFDTVLQKPFLPSQVEALLDAVETVEKERAGEEEEEAEEDIPAAQDEAQKPSQQEDDEFYFFLEEEALSEEEAEPVLDETEVARIKALLEESEKVSGEEPDTEDEAAYEARKVEAITENLKKEGLEIVEESDIVEHLTEEKPSAQSQPMQMDGETFFAMLHSLKPKKLRKLLKGAKVTVTIEFKE